MFDRVPPQNIEAEQAVIGSMLINPDAVYRAIEILSGDSSGLFYHTAHTHIYDSILRLVSQSQPVDAVVLCQDLNRQGCLDSCGGAAYLAELSGCVPTSANVEHYAGLVVESAMRRRLIESCRLITEQAYDGDSDIHTLMGQAEAGIFSVSQRQHRVSIHPIAELTEDAVTQIEAIGDRNSGAVGLPTGISDLDRIVTGLKPSDMIVLAARPSVGKTALALSIASHAAVEHGKGVLMFSLEMSKEQLTQRLLCREGRVDVRRLRDGYLASAERDKLRPAKTRLDASKLHIDDTPNITMFELISKSRRHAVRHETSLIIIDYLQLMGSVRRGENRQVEISEISRGVKQLARELNVPVLALSQLSREAEREDGPPKLSHLRESGSIEQDADLVWMLWRKNKDPQDVDNVLLRVAKHRNGQTGDVELVFLKNTQRFECASKCVEEPEPRGEAEQEQGVWYDK